MDDMRQCTLCHTYKWNHKLGLTELGFTDCSFEYKPFHVIDEDGKMHDFATSQEAIRFARAS